MKKSNRRDAAGKLRRKSGAAARRRKERFGFEPLEARQMMAFTAGDIAVLQLASTSNNTTGTVLELAPSGAAQTPALSVSVGSTGASAMRFSDSGTSSFLSDSSDGHLLILSGYNTTDTTDSDLASPTSPNTTADRAVATLDSNSNLTLQTTYTGTSGNQTRSATSLDDANYFVTDKGGLYTNGATSPSLTTNILDTRTFGGTVYVSSTKAAAGVSTLSSPTATSLHGLPGLGADADIQDFYMVQSGQNGSTYDVLYTLDQAAPTSSTAQINKYAFNGTTWQSEGTYALQNASGTAISATGMIAEENGSGGVSLYVLTTAQAKANSLVEYTDNAAYNAPVSVTSASAVTLYTASGSNTLKGIAFAPTASTTPIISSPASSSVEATTAISGGTVSDTGGQSVTSYGVVYSLTNPNPTLGGTNVLSQAGSGSAPISSAFGVNLSGLQPGSTYYYAAYATNSVGTSYTSVGTFATTVDSPTINAGSSITLGENHAAYNTTLTGINDGESDGNTNVTSVVATFTSSNPALFAAIPAVTNYSSTNGTAALGFTLAPNQSGTATITVTVTNSFNNTVTATYNLTVNPITESATPLGVFAGDTVAVTSADLDASESGVSAANIQYTLTGNPPAADGTIYRSGVALAQNSTFNQADVNSGLISYVSTGGTSATDNIPLTVSDLTNGGSLTGQSLSISVVAPPSSLGNLAVLQLGSTSDNTTGTVLYLSPTVTQSTPVQSIPISQMSFSDSGTSSFLTDSNDGTLLAFAAYNTTNYTATSDLGEDTATGSRGVGTVNANGTFNLATTYTNDIATSGTTEQTRSATTIDDSTWFITDKSGAYTNDDNNNGTGNPPNGPSNTTNVLVTRAFGGVDYVASTKALSAISTLSSPDATTLLGLPAAGSAAAPQTSVLNADGDIQDFYMIESGSNGNTYDVLYTLDQNSTNATINKFSLVGGSWVTSGTAYTLPANATGLTVANNGSGGASLYVVTTEQAADNSVVELNDTAGWNAPLAITAAPVTVYTATGAATLKGIAFAPSDLPNFSVTAAAPVTAALDSQFNYTLTATNAGPANAVGDVAVQFTLPPGLSYVSAADNGGNGFTANYDSTTNVVTFSGGTLNAGASDNLTVTVTAASAGTYTAAAGAVVIDPNHVVPEGQEFIGNFNTSAVSTRVTNEADLTVNVSGPSTAYANQPFNYTLTAANEGTVDAAGDATVQFTLPTSDANLQYVSASGTGFTVNEVNGVVTFSGGTIAAGTMETLTVTVEDTSPQLLAAGVATTNVATVPVGAAVIGTSDNIPESDDNQTSTSTVTTVISSPLELTGVDVSPVVNSSFTGVVATFSDATDANPGDFSATITWANGVTTSGTVGVAPNETVTDINGNTLNIDNLLTVTGTYTYSAVGSYPVSVSVSDANNNSATVALTASVAYAPLVVTAGPAVNAFAGVPLSNLSVATFTDPGLVANLTALGISDPTTQFSATINWGDGSTAASGTISYDSATQTFSVAGSHTYAQTGPYSISVAVTPMTVSVERIDSSDPTNLNAVDNQDSENEVNGQLADNQTAVGLTDAASPDFIDQYVIGAANQTGSLYTFGLPTVAATSGNFGLTDNSSSRSEGELTLSANGQYLVTGGYNATVDLWAPEPGISTAPQVSRVIATVSGTGVINTTTALSDAYTAGNFRGVVSSDGTQFWTAGSSVGSPNEYTHYAQLGATTSTVITGPTDPADTSTVEIINGQLYESSRTTPGNTLAGIYQVGTGLPSTAGQPQSLFIETPQSNPLNVTDGESATGSFGFFMADLPSNPYSINGVNVAYTSDEQMGVARYDYTASGWKFSYYIDSTGSYLDSAYTVDGNGNVTPTSSAVTANPAAFADPSKAGGARDLTGRVVDGQVQLFFLTGFGTGSRPLANESVYEVTDTGANSGLTALATDAGTSQLTGVALTPTQTVTSSAMIGLVTPTVSVTDAGGTYNGSPFAVTSVAATGAGGLDDTNLGDFSYSYAGSGTTSYGPSATAPSTAGAYTVTASFAGSTDYTSATGNDSFTIAQATPTVNVSAAGGTYNGSAFTATGNVNGGATLEGVSPTVSYYSGTSASGTALSAAPWNAGTYTVVASFAGSADYSSAQSSPETFVISPFAVNYTIGNAVETAGTQLNLASVLPATLSTGVGSQTLALSYTSTGDTATAALGTYPINATASDTSTGMASNYSVSFTPGTLSVISSPTVGILLLDNSGNSSLNVSGSGNVSVTGGGNLILDSTDKSGAVTVSGAAVVSAATVDAQSTSVSGSGKVQGTLNKTAGATADPLASLPVPAIPSNVQSSAKLVVGGNSVVTLEPGLYIGGIQITGSAKATLAPGIYYLEGGGFTVSGAASVTGTGVLLYNASPAGGGNAGSITISGSGEVTLTGMESGIYQGIAIFQARTATAAIQISGAAGLNVIGSVYAAASTVQVSGSGSLNLNGATITEGSSVLVLTDSLIVADMQVSGAADVEVNTSDNDLALSANAVDYYFGQA